MTEVTITDAVRNLLNNDVVLQGYLCGTDRVIVGWVNQNTVFPCITIFDGAESSRMIVGYYQSKKRLNSPSIQIDSWVDKNHEGFPCTSRDLNIIADRVDELLFGTGVTNTYGWERASSVELQENTVSSTIYHKMRRYGFRYRVKDS